MGSKVKRFTWSYGRVRAALYTCKTWNEFCREYPAAYRAVYTRYHMCDIRMMFEQGAIGYKWTLPWVMDSCKPYPTLATWCAKETAAYNAARRRGYMDVVRSNFDGISRR